MCQLKALQVKRLPTFQIDKKFLNSLIENSMQNSSEKHIIVDVEGKDTQEINSEDQRSRKPAIFDENHAITKQTKKERE